MSPPSLPPLPPPPPNPEDSPQFPEYLSSAPVHLPPRDPPTSRPRPDDPVTAIDVWVAVLAALTGAALAALVWILVAIVHFHTDPFAPLHPLPSTLTPAPASTAPPSQPVPADLFSTRPHDHVPYR